MSVRMVDRCPFCPEGTTDKCKVIGGEGLLIKIQCQCCGLTWQTLDTEMPKEARVKTLRTLAAAQH